MWRGDTSGLSGVCRRICAFHEEYKIRSKSLMDNYLKAFFALLRAGLWEQSVRLLPFEPLDFDSLFELAEEQAVVGLIGAGLEHVEDRKVTKPEAVRFLKNVFSLECRNLEINGFIEKLTGRLRSADVYALLVKGQGVAQCYERSGWRSVGDIDLLVDDENYRKAKEFLATKAESIGVEEVDKKHLGMTIDSWTVELHGTLHNGLSRRSDKVVDEIQDDSLRGGNVVMWRNGETDVPLPGPDNHILFVFTHILQHFFHGGIGLRQICDWCRLLWTYRESIDRDLLESRLRRMGLMSEWRVFASLAVHYLGYQASYMPLYCESGAFARKADRVLALVLKKGSFGRKVDKSYMKTAPVLQRKIITIWRQLKESVSFLSIFPMDTFRFLGFFFVEGVSRTRKTTKF